MVQQTRNHWNLKGLLGVLGVLGCLIQIVYGGFMQIFIVILWGFGGDSKVVLWGQVRGLT
jgi:hypothetical protein